MTLARAAAAGAVTLLAAAACAPTPPAAPTLFESLAPAATGVSFANTVPDTSSFNILTYLYYYNGGGVAAGDVNGDGLPDLYFSANLGPNRLYLNRGDFRFEDVTARAGVAGPPGWKTGVTMADVNGDGKLDLYVSGVDYRDQHGRNALYVNRGDGTFDERTAEYGLAHVGYSTQALFFDYDTDGDLDAYLLQHSTHTERQIGSGGRADGSLPSADRLLRNEGGKFVDVSAQAGIRDGIDGYGLGVVASDLNGDGCVDLYVANDFQGDDQLYVNRCDGTFVESAAAATRHTSRFSMGVDAADVNDDGRPDVFVADMLPEREEILKTSASYETPNLFALRLRAGYHPQYARNTLQLNRGRGLFSDVGYLAGVHATDWSWAPLFADLDDDGRKDLFVTSGIWRRPNDMDYISFVANDAVQAQLARGGPIDPALLKQLPHVPVPSHAYRNEGGLRFTDMAAAWGLGTPGFANGAAYVDLDNDGALDLVVNQLNAPAAIYRNRARARTGNAWLSVTLRGEGANTQGIGAKVVAKAGGVAQLVEQMPTRGFLSSVDARPHFGLGRAQRVDSLVVTWPDRRVQVLTNVAANQAIVVAQKDAALPAPAPPDTLRPLFADVTDSTTIPWRHREDAFYDWDREPLVPRLTSTEGPALAVADVDGDGLDDVFAGGGKWQAGTLLLQRRDGSLAPSVQPDLAADSLAEDVDAAFLDANGDGRPDLVVAGGGNEFWAPMEPLRPRLYLNDGAGRLRRAADAIPAVFENAGCIVPGDFDGDGHVDLFLGARVVARRYGETPASHLLRNDGTGRFVDVTAAVAPELARAGMVASAAWTDVDGDGRLDLVAAGDWMPVRVYLQRDGKLVERTAQAGLGGTDGWWSSVQAADLDGDGDHDLVLGNVGRNSYVTASATRPARLYLNDFLKDGTLQQVLTFHKGDRSYPMYGRDELVKRIPSLRSRYTSYAAFGASTIDDIFPREDVAQARVLEARTLESAIALNDGRGGFAVRALPVEAQFAPVYASLADDFDGDGTVDLLLGGNFHGAPPIMGRYDASYGLLLHGAGGGRFVPVDLERSGVVLQGEVRKLRQLRGAGGARLVVAARSGDRLQLLRAPAARATPSTVAARLVNSDPARPQ